MPLFRLRNGPDESNGMRRFATALLRIAHPQMVFLRCLELDLSGERLMDVLRVSAEEIEALTAENPALAEALTQRRPPTNWVRNPSGEMPPVFVRAALRLKPEELETIEVTSAKLKPVDWLVDTALDSCRFFPEAVDLRQIFMKKLPCADGEEYTAATAKKEN